MEHCWEGEYHQRLGSNVIIGDLDGNGKQDLVISSENDPLSTKWSSGLLDGKIIIIWNYI
jgi:hypothetical protein